MNTAKLVKLTSIVIAYHRWENYIGNPIPVDSSSLERMKEMRAGRQHLCIYDQEMQDATLVHFAAIPGQPGGRLLGESIFGIRLSQKLHMPDSETLDAIFFAVHFYAFLFFQVRHLSRSRD